MIFKKIKFDNDQLKEMGREGQNLLLVFHSVVPTTKQKELLVRQRIIESYNAYDELVDLAKEYQNLLLSDYTTTGGRDLSDGSLAKVNKSLDKAKKFYDKVKNSVGSNSIN